MKKTNDYWIVSTTMGGYSEEEVYDLEEAKSMADEWEGLVQDKDGQRVYISKGYDLENEM